jgi:hypothetical protein
MIRNDFARHVKLADKRDRQKEYSLSERKAQAERRVVNRDRLGLPEVREVISHKDIIPAPMGIKSLETKTFSQTKTDAKSTEYRYEVRNGVPTLVKRFTDGYGNDPWQLLGTKAIEALPQEAYVFKPSGKPAKAWRKGNERPTVTDRLGRIVSK